ncbi:MAG: CdaR family protein [Lachnospiraceae bacterium]
MFKKLMKHVTNDIGLKILSILFSVVLWLVVINIANPDKTKSFSIPVEIQNKNIIEEMGKVPDVVGDTDIASFYIIGPRNYVEDMEASDFTVTADLSQIDLTQDYDIKLVPIQISVKKNEKYITVYNKTVNMKITLEELSEQTFVVSPEITGTPDNGYAIGEAEVTPNLLKISGPKSIVSKINKVLATINVDGIASDVSDNVIPVLYDEEGNVISSDLLEMNQSVVTIKANVLGTKSIPIKGEITGTPADGYEYMGTEYAPETVTIKGEASVLNTTYAVNIPGEIINIDGATQNLEIPVDINEWLPEGVSLVDDKSNKIAIKVLIEQKQTKIINLPVESITVTGLSNNHTISYNGTTIPITIRGLASNLESFTAAQLQVKLDTAGLEPGAHIVGLQVSTTDEKYESMGTVSVQITIVDKNAPINPGGGNPGVGGPASVNPGGSTGTGPNGN